MRTKPSLDVRLVTTPFTSARPGTLEVDSFVTQLEPLLKV
jgi:hypothetical protein